jgi:thiamine pyrophosphate-dependent acetolactate synthase large subunit-like protein
MKMTPQELKAQKVALATAPPGVVLDRGEAVPKLIGAHEDFLIVAGLGGVAHDVGSAAGDSAHVFSLSGAMGAPCMIGLGLALAQPNKRVLVVTGDGDLLMNSGALATIAVMNPPNLAIVCVDNGHYGETGWQKSHTSLGVDLEKIAIGSGIKRTLTVTQEGDLARGSRFIREGNSAGFVLLRVVPTEPPHFKRNFDAAFCRDRFRRALQGKMSQ